MGAAFAVAMNNTATRPIAPVLSLWPHSTGTSTNSWLAIARSPFCLDGPRPPDGFPGASYRCVLDHPERHESRTAGRRRTRSRVEIVCFRFVREHTIDTTIPKGMHFWLNQLPW